MRTFEPTLPRSTGLRPVSKSSLARTLTTSAIAADQSGPAGAELVQDFPGVIGRTPGGGSGSEPAMRAGTHPERWR